MKTLLNSPKTRLNNYIPEKIQGMEEKMDNRINDIITKNQNEINHMNGIITKNQNVINNLNDIITKNQNDTDQIFWSNMEC